MKKIMFFALAAALILSACSTTVPIKENVEINPLAVVTIYSNNEMAWDDAPSEESTGGFILGIVKDIASKKDDKVSNMIFDGTQDLLALASETITAELAYSSRPVIEESVLLKSNSYMKTKNYIADHPQSITADGYKYIVNNGHDLNLMLKKELGVNGALYIQFDFMKTMLSGAIDSGELGCYVFLKAFILNSEGKLVYSDSFYAESEDGIPVLARLYDPEELHKLFPPLIKQVCREFVSEL